MPSISDRVAALHRAASDAPRSTSDFAGLSEGELTGLIRQLRVASDCIAAALSAAAHEVARQSAPELGHAGLAQRNGARTPERFVQQLTGVSKGDARALVQAGVALHDAELVEAASRMPDPDAAAQALASVREPWLAPAGAAVRDGSLPSAVVGVLRTALRGPTERISAADLQAAVRELVCEAIEERWDLDELTAAARDALVQLDAAVVARDQAERYRARYARVYRQRDGMVRVEARLAPEEGGELLLAAVENALAPQRGGPRFVDPDAAPGCDGEAAVTGAKAGGRGSGRGARGAVRAETPPVSPEQLAADVLVQLITAGSTVPATEILGARKPAVQVLVTADHLDDSGAGAAFGIGRIQGQQAPITIARVRREICDSGIVPVLFDTKGDVLRQGRELRTFNRAQRRALAARDGGCRWPGCERPASWTEAHHIDHWKAHDGATDIDNGVLLCRHHHLLLHDNGWEIHRVDGQLTLVPPASIDGMRRPRPMPSKSLAARDLLRAQSARDAEQAGGGERVRHVATGAEHRRTVVTAPSFGPPPGPPTRARRFGAAVQVRRWSWNRVV